MEEKTELRPEAAGKGRGNRLEPGGFPPQRQVEEHPRETAKVAR